MNLTVGMWPGPLLFLLAAMALAAVAYLLHRWPFLSALVTAAGCLTLAWIAARQLSSGQVTVLGRALELESPLVILGRTWALTRSSLAALALLYTVAGLVFLFALPASQGWSFYPFGVGMVGVLSLAITAQQYVYAILFTWLAAHLAVFVLAGGRPGETTGALRFLVFTSVAVMPLLILPRYLEPDPTGYVVAASAGVPALPDQAAQVARWLMVGGVAVLLMMVPFYGQLVAIGTHSAPMALPLMLTAFPVVVLHTLFELWRAQPVLIQDPLFFQVCLWMGIATTAIGGLAAVGQRRWGALAGYATLVDWGAGLIALGQGTLESTDLAVRMLVWRALSMLLVGTGWNALFKATAQRDDLERCRGLLLRRPLSLLALLIGLFSLAGYPLTPGAVGRWSLLNGLVSRSYILTTRASMWAWLIGRHPTQPEALWVLLLAGIGVSIGTLSGVRACLGTPQPDVPQSDDEPPESAGRPRAARSEVVDTVISITFALLALWLVGASFLQPKPWLKLGQELLAGLSFPGE